MHFWEKHPHVLVPYYYKFDLAYKYTVNISKLCLLEMSLKIFGLKW